MENGNVKNISYIKTPNLKSVRTKRGGHNLSRMASFCIENYCLHQNKLKFENVDTQLIYYAQ